MYPWFPVDPVMVEYGNIVFMVYELPIEEAVEGGFKATATDLYPRTGSINYPVIQDIINNTIKIIHYCFCHLPIHLPYDPDLKGPAG